MRILPISSLLATAVPEPLTTLNIPSCGTASCSAVNGKAALGGVRCPKISEGWSARPEAMREVITASCNGETET